MTFRTIFPRCLGLIVVVASANPALAQCTGFCGDQSPAGCWCDDACRLFGDCCNDNCTCQVPQIAAVHHAAMPAGGPTVGGTPITVQGMNFGESEGIILLDDDLMVVTSWQDTQIIAQSPPGTGLNLQITVINDIAPPIPCMEQGQSNPGDPTQSFSYAAPSIIELLPQNGPSVGGTLVTLNGQIFGPEPGIVTLDGNPMTVDSWDHSQIKAFTPASCGVDRSIVVETLSGGSNPMPFDYSPPYPPGDMTCDCSVDPGDIAPFVEALVDPENYAGCDPQRADMNLDGLINGDDVQRFAALLMTP